MKEILLLVHRIPFPPNKGDKLRSFHLLKALRKSFRVHLGTFVDNPKDWQYLDDLKGLCGDVLARPLYPARARIRSLYGFLRGTALTLPYYSDRRMREWVRDVIARRGIQAAVVFSSSMAQYVEGREFETLRRVIDFVDIDSDKWRQYAESKPWPLSSVYRREARRLLAAEKDIAGQFDACTFVSELEAQQFRSLAPDVAAKVSAVRNGVDSRYFDPDLDLANPFEESPAAIVFTGAMDYWPNADAATWFARDILPAVREAHPQAVFYVVGSNPTDAVRDLEKKSAVRVTGTVPDVRPYIAHARVVVAPLRIARGVQNKVLEALALDKPVVATQPAIDGIDCGDLDGVSIAAMEAQPMADATIRELRGPESPHRAGVRRNFVREQYDWQRNLQAIAQLAGSDVT